MSIQIFRKNKELLIILLVFFVIKIFFLIKPHFVGWDEAVYVGMGKYIYSLGASGLWEDLRPIGLPLILGALWKLGLPVFRAAEVTALFFSISNLILVYFIGRKLFSKWVGILSAILLGSAPVFFSQSSLFMTSIPSTFFALCAFYFYISEKPKIYVGIFTGMALLFRFPQGLALAVFTLLIILSRRGWSEKLNDAGYLFIGFFAVLIPFFVFNYFLYNSITENFFDAILRPFIFAVMHQSNPFNQGNAYFYLVSLFRQNYLFLFGLLGLIYSYRRKVYSLLMFFFIYLFYFSSIVNKQERFLLLFLPYASLTAGYGLYNIYLVFNKRDVLSKMGLAILLLFALLSLIPVIQSNYQNYDWRANVENSIVPFFKNFDNKGTILTASPLPAAYSDNLFIPFYDNPDVALEVYDKFIGEVQFVLYSPQFYPCEDAPCAVKKELLSNMISEQELIAQTGFGEFEYFLYSVNS